MECGCEVWSVKCEVWSVECGVWVWSVGVGVTCEKRGQKKLPCGSDDRKARATARRAVAGWGR